MVSIVGPSRSSKPPCPLCRMLLALQWNVNSAYTMAAIATNVNRPAEIWPTLSPKLRSPTARPPRITVKLSHERKVRSLAKKTLGSTRVGRAIRLPATLLVDRCRGGESNAMHTRSSLEERLCGHDDESSTPQTGNVMLYVQLEVLKRWSIG